MELRIGDAQRAGLDALAELCAQEARVFAGQVAQLEALAALAALERRETGVEQFLVMEVAGTCGWGQGAAAGRLADAHVLSTCLPQSLALLADGAWTVPAAKALLWGTRACREAVAQEVERRLLALPDVLTWSPAQVRRHVADLVLEVEAELDGPVTAEREADAAEGRRVGVRPEPDAMSSVWALLRAEQGRGFALGLDELARRQAEVDAQHGTARTADQRRADLLAGLPGLALHVWEACGGLPGPGALDDATAAALRTLPAAAHPAVQLVVHVPLASALGRSEQPADLDGHGPISAATARRLLPGAALRRLLVDAATGRPVHVDSRTTPAAGSHAAAQRVLLSWAAEAGHAGTVRAAGAGALDDGARAGQETSVGGEELLADVTEPQYVPSRPLDRLVRLRDRSCTGPGCSRPARVCDLDHRDPWPLGATSADNLGALSRRCHNAKTHGGWRLRRDRDGTTVWTSPLGRTYRRAAPWRPPPAADLHPVEPAPRTHSRPPARLDRDAPLWPQGTSGLPHVAEQAGLADCPF